MNIETRQSLRAVLNYLLRDERIDFELRPEGQRKNHIYHHVQRVIEWLEDERHFEPGPLPVGVTISNRSAEGTELDHSSWPEHIRDHIR